METRSLNFSPKTTTIEQFALLIQKLEEHPELAQRAPADGAAARKLTKLWQDITQELNAKGPPKRSVEEWKKVLYDSKAKKIQRQIHKKEAGCSKVHFLETEKALEKAIHFTETIKPKGDTFGLPNIANFSNININPALAENLEVSCFLASAANGATDPLSPTYAQPTTSTACKYRTKSSPHSVQKEQISSKRKLGAVPQAIPSHLIRRQLSQENEYLEVTRDIAHLMNTLSKYFGELKEAAIKQRKLMEYRLELLERQTAAIERQAAALERMSSF